MPEIKVGHSPLTNEIHAGTVYDNRQWGRNKTEVTMMALCSVAEHVLQFGEPVEICEADGTPVYKITVERI